MSDTLFVQDGKRLDSIRWPFKKYMVLMPERNEVDAFAWLFASFVKMYNLKKGNGAYDYNTEIENVVKGQIRLHFGNVIDVPTLNKVITQMKKYLDPDHPDSIKVFQNLFTDNMRIKYVFQDCITGSVVPYFYDEVEVESELPRAADFEGGLKPVKKAKPVKKYVKLAYKRYLHREDYIREEIEEVIQEFQEDEELLRDEDNQLFEEDEEFTVKKEESGKEGTADAPLRKFDIKFLDEGEVIYYNVPVSIEDNRLFVETPFDVSTSSWMNVCFVKGSKENKALKEIYDRLSANITSEQKIDRFFEDSKNSIYEKLPNCADLYRIVDPLGDRKLREMVWRLENYYVRRDPEFFVKSAVILERLLKLVIKTGEYVPSDKEFREYASKETVHRLLNAKCSHVDCYHLKKGELFTKWKNKYVNPEDRYGINARTNSNWKPRFDFKSDFLDLMIQSDISKSPLMKYETVNNIWKLWNRRNKQGHDDDYSVPMKVTPEDLEIMKESAKLLSQKIKGGAQ